MVKALQSRKQVHRDIAFYLTTLISFSLAFKAIVPILIGLLVINWFVEGNFAEKFAGGKTVSFLLLFLSFYALHAAALLYTNNIPEGMSNLEVKLSLLIFPIVFFTTKFSAPQFKTIMLAFIAGCLAAGVACLARAGWCYFAEQQNYFFYEDFSYFMHPSYFSMYVNLAVFLLLKSFFMAEYRRKGKRIWVIFLFIFMSLLIFLLSSKLGIISYLLLCGIFLLTECIRRKKYTLLTVVFVLGITGTFSAYKLSPTIKSRFDYMFRAVNEENISKAEMESSAVRVLIWGEAKKIISQNLVYGVSPGDTNDRLYKAYEENGITGAFQNRLNAHNQYFQSFIGLGLIGFVLFLAQFIFPLVHAIRKNKMIYLLFILLIALNFLVESMLQTQAGVIFYAFFNSLFLFHEKNSERAEFI
jgi:O-antigen ligase